MAHLQAEIHERDERFYPCVVFSDLNMPWLDGEELAKWIRRQPELARTKVIVVSSSENPDDVARALAAGANKFFVKYPAAGVLQA